jgi:putative membrane protein
MKRLFAILLLLLACSPDQQPHEKPSPEPAPSANLATQDRDFLERAAQGNNAEVKIGGLVNGRSENGAVIGFGNMMVADHGSAQQRLAVIAKELHITLPESLGDSQEGYDRLVEKRREPFDDEFTRVMVQDHQRALELYKGEAANGVEPRITAYAQSMVPVIEAHLDEAARLRQTFGLK